MNELFKNKIDKIKQWYIKRKSRKFEEKTDYIDAVWYFWNSNYNNEKSELSGKKIN